MILVFRDDDYVKMREAANVLEIDLASLMIEAGTTINFFDNIYQNPPSMDNYSNFHQFELNSSNEDFDCLFDKANREGTSIEIMLFKAIEMYRFMYEETIEVSSLNYVM